MPHEPMTVLTDYLLAAWCAGLGVLILSCRNVPGQGRWGLGFLFTAAAALLGGTWHGWSGLWPPLAGALLWKGTVWSVGLADFCLLTGVLAVFPAAPWRRALELFATLKLVIYLGWMTFHDDFLYVVLDYLPTLFLLLILSLLLWRTSKRLSRAIWLGVMLSLGAAAVQRSSFCLGPFNHNDLYHLVQMAAFYAFFRAGRLFPRAA